MFRSLVLTMVIGGLIFGVSGCSDDPPKKIALQETRELESQGNNETEQSIHIAVGGMITPKEGITYYRDLLQYIGEKMGEKVKYVDREGYAQINEMLKNGKLQAAFVCSGPYVDGKKEFGLELLVAPQAYGESVYYAYIIVAKDSGYRTFQDLAGKRFAFTDPLSNTGKLVPTYMLAKMGKTPETFFSQIIYTQSHDKSIKAVAQGIVDGAAVDSLIWEFLNATDPKFTSKTQILKKSPPYAIPPVAVPANLDPVLKTKLKQTLLNAHLDPQGKVILSKMKIDKFITIDDDAYNSVRQMQHWIDTQKTVK